MHLLAFRRRLRLQPFDRVKDSVPGGAAGHVAVGHELVSTGGRLDYQSRRGNGPVYPPSAIDS